MGMLLGKYIPIEMLARMPLPFVHRLRDIRIKQLEEQKRRQDLLNAQMKHPTSNNNALPKMPIGGLDDSDLDDLVDDLAGI